ncbi:MAG: branched-chain amino acid ABC transporter permease [Deltaproteobacteria bacterium]|nr:branched-chain amino acid ABC transporter permease [Deltaproteobacteria bacterium]
MDLKRSYREDLKLFESRAHLVAFAVLVVTLAILPFAIQDFYLYMLSLIATNVLVAIGLNILVGYTGQISLGHAGFFAIGAYTQALLVTKAGLPFPLALPIAGFVSAWFGVLLALPALRLTGPYLAIATLGFGMAVTQIIGHAEFFGGRNGIKVPKPDFLASALTDDQRMYIVIIPITVVLAIVAYNLMRSRVGRAMVAVRDSDIAAETMGINLVVTKSLSFAVSAFFTGVAGGLMAHLLGFINPDIFNLMLSIQFLAMVVVGGLGSILGSILGAILMTLLPQLLSGVKDFPLIIYGAIMVAIVMLEPMGLRGRWLKVKIYWKKWPF